MQGHPQTPDDVNSLLGVIEMKGLTNVIVSMRVEPSNYTVYVYGRH
jgi:hypothetical protein